MKQYCGTTFAASDVPNALGSARVPLGLAYNQGFLIHARGLINILVYLTLRED